MAYGHGAVAGLRLLHEQRCHRLADDIAATQDHGMLAACLDAVSLEKLHDAGGGGRQKAWQSGKH